MYGLPISVDRDGLREREAADHLWAQPREWNKLAIFFDQTQVARCEKLEPELNNDGGVEGQSHRTLGFIKK